MAILVCEVCKIPVSDKDKTVKRFEGINKHVLCSECWSDDIMAEIRAIEILWCKKCGMPIDQKTIDWFEEQKHRRKPWWPKRDGPSICGQCLADAIFKMIDELEEEE